VHLGQGYAGVSSGARTVYVTQVDTHVLMDGSIVNRPAALSHAAFAAIAGSSTLRGHGSDAGWFAIPSVPAGEFTLTDGGGLYLISDADAFDLGQEVLGRTDAVAPTQATTIQFDVSSLFTWTANDDLEFDAPAANVWYQSLAAANAAGLPAPGATAISGMTLDALASGQDLIGGDQAYLGDLVYQTLADGTAYQALSRAFVPDPFVQTDGGQTTLTGSFVQLSETSTQFDLEYTQFAAVTGMGPGTPAFYGAQFIILGQPVESDDGGFSSQATLAFPVYEPMNDTSATFSYAMPPFGTWVPVGYNDAYYGVDYALGGATPFTDYAVIERGDLLGRIASQPLVPALGPVGHPTIAGMDALATTITGIGFSPTVAWEPPAVGTATSYVVRLNHLVDVGGATTPVNIATFVTHGTSVTIPRGLVQSTQAYYLSIEARAVDLDAVTAPDRLDFPWTFSLTLTGELMP
jgi:hypothetical protein